MAAGKRTLTVNIIREAGSIYYGECSSVTVPSLRDAITILPYHTPLIMKLGPGPVILRTEGEKIIPVEVKTGLIYVGDNEVVVLVDL